MKPRKHKEAVVIDCSDGSFAVAIESEVEGIDYVVALPNMNYLFARKEADDLNTRPENHTIE